jgi:monoterpene epsilon-lactone hydrolase
MNPSLGARIFAWILKVSNFKRIVAKRTKRPIARSKRGFVPPGIKRSFLTKIQTCNNHSVATFASKERVSQHHLIFLHGGAYLFEASAGHWSLAKKIVNQSFCRMSLLDYPLAPEHRYGETFQMVEEAYALLLDQYPDDDFVFLGDSAGGGLALSLVQKLIKEKHPRLPVKNILLSPWLDMAMSNPAVKSLETSDYVLSLEMLQTAARKYANGEDLAHYLLSPINGEFREIPETMVFYGGQELFYADCVKLQSMVGANQEPFHFREYEGMQHDWAILPIREREMVVDEICAFLKA